LTTKMNITKHTIDAKGKKLGRVASEAAAYLMGKNSTEFVRNKVVGMKVSIINASKADISEKKLTEKVYKKYSGYPGGLSETKMNLVIDKKGYEEVFKIAIHGMLPSNRLRDILMKNLTITE